jgi:hypothetical protein
VILCILCFRKYYLQDRQRVHGKQQKQKPSWAPVAHACNPCYTGGRDQKDHGLKPAQANSFQDLFLKKPIAKKKKTGGVS